MKHDILTYKNKINFDTVMAEMEQIIKTNLLQYSIYNPRFNKTCLVCDTLQKKRHKKDSTKCSNSNIWNLMLNAKFKNGTFCYQ